MPKVKSNCKRCGKETEFWPSQARSFCSQQCRSQYNAEHGWMPTKPRRGTSIPCAACGKLVYRAKGQSTKRYCSVACAHLGLRAGEDQPCEGCGTLFHVAPSFGDRRFCSRECYDVNRVLGSAIGREHNGRQVIKDHGGYLRIWQPDHPAASNGRVLEHRWVVEQILGRQLRTDEHVHHVNGVKDDNRPENLQVLDAQEHRLLTAAEIKEKRAADTAELAEYRKRYGPLE